MLYPEKNRLTLVRFQRKDHLDDNFLVQDSPPYRPTLRGTKIRIGEDSNL